MPPTLIKQIRTLYPNEHPIPLHRPVLGQREKDLLVECVDSTFVSSVGEMIVEFERRVAEFCGAGHAVAVVNGTAGLQVALRVAGVARDCEVITQALTFVGTCNAIAHAGAQPVFVDVERDTLGMSPEALRSFLEAHAERRDDGCYNRGSGRRIAGCMPMHTFGLPCRVNEIVAICDEWGIAVVEDAAEALGSWREERHCGTFGRLGVFSFNGNKIITTGGGGMIVTDDEDLARHARHLTTTAKRPHPYEYIHDEVGYNYRMPNLNAALGCAQMERLPGFLDSKCAIAERYRDFCSNHGLEFVESPAGCRTNHWLNAVILDSRAARDEFLETTNAAGIMTRPIWRLMNELPMFEDCQRDGLETSKWLEERVVNLPSSV